MKVKELIEQLSKFSGEMELAVNIEGEDYDYPIADELAVWGSCLMSRFGGGWEVNAKEGAISLTVKHDQKDQIVWSEPGERFCDVACCENEAPEPDIDCPMCSRKRCMDCARVNKCGCEKGD